VKRGHRRIFYIAGLCLSLVLFCAGNLLYSTLYGAPEEREVRAWLEGTRTDPLVAVEITDHDYMGPRDVKLTDSSSLIYVSEAIRRAIPAPSVSSAGNGSGGGDIQLILQFKSGKILHADGCVWTKAMTIFAAETPMQSEISVKIPGDDNAPRPLRDMLTFLCDPQAHGERSFGDGK